MPQVRCCCDGATRRCEQHAKRRAGNSERPPKAAPNTLQIEDKDGARRALPSPNADEFPDLQLDYIPENWIRYFTVSVMFVSSVFLSFRLRRRNVLTSTCAAWLWRVANMD